ncbi:hypothetical protein ACXYX3_17595 [Mycobacterium sp. C3-094]
MQVARLCHILAASVVATIAVDLAIAYWWLTWGPFPESAWPA